MHLIIDAYFPGYIPSSKQSVYTDEERALIRRLLENPTPMPTLDPEEPDAQEDDEAS